ncbi:hypothetical protein C1645_751065 [Glomus cerebriforme]|uniref:Uncharacterized protein n=1 Tax=Glomus cerebriforme TaxID=658196 RepID=A0A397TIW4_9GLOM|nr:hypothetical protein C1645_751065 [Glomus cerebriforme]
MIFPYYQMKKNNLYIRIIYNSYVKLCFLYQILYYLEIKKPGVKNLIVIKIKRAIILILEYSILQIICLLLNS